MCLFSMAGSRDNQLHHSISMANGESSPPSGGSERGLPFSVTGRMMTPHALPDLETLSLRSFGLACDAVNAVTGWTIITK